MSKSESRLSCISDFIPRRYIIVIEVGKQSDHIDATDSIGAPKNNSSLANFFLEFLHSCNLVC